MDFFNRILEKFSSSKKDMSLLPPNPFPGFLDTVQTKQQFEVTLSKIQKISPDSYIYTYDLPDPNVPLGLRCGHHIAIHANAGIGGLSIRRKYTPISKFDQKGSFDMLIKIYRPNSHPEFPGGGRLTPHLETMKIGDKVTMSGTKFKKTYCGHGRFIFKGTEYNVKEFAMIAGGTGIAPMYQIIRAILDDPTDPTKVHLLFANRSEEDVLMKEQLDEAAKDPRIKIHYTVDHAPQSWKGYRGFITKEMLTETMPKPETNPLLWACGPKPMKKSVKAHLKDLGYNLENSLV